MRRKACLDTHPDDVMHMKRTPERLFDDNSRWSVIDAGLVISTPDEAREILQLKGSSLVASWLRAKPSMFSCANAVNTNGREVDAYPQADFTGGVDPKDRIYQLVDVFESREGSVSHLQ